MSGCFANDIKLDDIFALSVLRLFYEILPKNVNSDSLNSIESYTDLFEDLE